MKQVRARGPTTASEPPNIVDPGSRGAQGEGSGMWLQDLEISGPGDKRRHFKPEGEEGEPTGNNSVESATYWQNPEKLAEFQSESRSTRHRIKKKKKKRSP